MRVGKFKIGKVYPNDKTQWAIMGRGSSGRWVVCLDQQRKPADLLFDLEYDACAYLEGFIEWQTGELLQRQIAQKNLSNQHGKNYPVNSVKKINKKAKSKMAKKSRMRNR